MWTKTNRWMPKDRSETTLVLGKKLQSDMDRESEGESLSQSVVGGHSAVMEWTLGWWSVSHSAA